MHDDEATSSEHYKTIAQHSTIAKYLGLYILTGSARTLSGKRTLAYIHTKCSAYAPILLTIPRTT